MDAMALMYKCDFCVDDDIDALLYGRRKKNNIIRILSYCIVVHYDIMHNDSKRISFYYSGSEPVDMM